MVFILRSLLARLFVNPNLLDPDVSMKGIPKFPVGVWYHGQKLTLEIHLFLLFLHRQMWWFSYSNKALFCNMAVTFISPNHNQHRFNFLVSIFKCRNVSFLWLRNKYMYMYIYTYRNFSMICSLGTLCRLSLVCTNWSGHQVTSWSHHALSK